MATYNWKSAVSGDWSGFSNWTPSGPPSTISAANLAGGVNTYSFDDAVFNTGAGSTNEYTITGTAHAASIRVLNDTVVFGAGFSFSDDAGIDTTGRQPATHPTPTITVDSAAHVTVAAGANLNLIYDNVNPYYDEGFLNINSGYLNVYGSVSAKLAVGANGTLIVSGVGASFQTISGTHGGPTAYDTVAAGGSIDVGNGATFAGTFSNMDGTINLNGVTASSGGTIGADGIVNGSDGATFAEAAALPLFLNGEIVANHGLFTVRAPEFYGTGGFKIETGARLAIGSLDVRNDIVFDHTGSDAVFDHTGAAAPVLTLDAGAKLTGLIRNFSGGDSITIGGVAPGNLTIYDINGRTMVIDGSSFYLDGDYKLSDFAVSSDGAGGTRITNVRPVPVPPPPPAPQPYEWLSATNGSWNNATLWAPGGGPKVLQSQSGTAYSIDSAFFSTHSSTAYAVSGAGVAAALNVLYDTVLFDNFTFGNNVGSGTSIVPTFSVIDNAHVTVGASSNVGLASASANYQWGTNAINNATLTVQGTVVANLDVEDRGVLNVATGGTYRSPVEIHTAVPKAVIEQGGTVNVAAGATFEAVLARMNGTLNVVGSSVRGGAIGTTGVLTGRDGATLVAGTYLNGGDISNNGTIAALAGVFTIQSGATVGSGVMQIAANATLSLTGITSSNTPDAITSTNNVQFDVSATLKLSLNARISGLLVTFGKGDVIDLGSALVTNLTATDVNGVTTVTAYRASTVLNTFKLAGDYSLNDLGLSSDGAGGSLISFVDHTPVPVVVVPDPTPTPVVVAPDPTPTPVVTTPNPAPTPTMTSATVSLSEGREGDTFVLGGDGAVTFTHGGKVDILGSGVHEIDFIDGREVFDSNDHVASIVRLYQAALGRAPDEAGLHYWSYAMEHGSTLNDLADGFQSSPEFTNRFGANLPSADYVTRLYQNVLGRNPEPAGLTYWKGNLDNGTATRAQTLAGISESAENKTATAATVAGGIWDLDETAAQVARLYDTALGRLPDTAGLAYWTLDIKHGAPLLDLATAFVGSAEFKATYGALDNAAFVDTVYHNTLHRAADPAGASYWVNMLNTGASRAQVVIGFSESPEHLNNTAPNIMASNTADYGIRLA